MSETTVTRREFRGVRVEIKSAVNFDEVLRRLQEQTANSSVPQINEVAARSKSVEEFEAEVKKQFVGPSDFMVFSKIDHSDWIGLYGIKRRVLRIILGNPLIAITMMREDITAGLFAPVEMLLVEDGAGSALYFVLPSSLMVIDKNERLQRAAVALDEKLERLAATIS